MEGRASLRPVQKPVLFRTLQRSGVGLCGVDDQAVLLLIQKLHGVDRHELFDAAGIDGHGGAALIPQYLGLRDKGGRHARVPEAGYPPPDALRREGARQREAGTRCVVAVQCGKQNVQLHQDTEILDGVYQTAGHRTDTGQRLYPIGNEGQLDHDDGGNGERAYNDHIDQYPAEQSVFQAREGQAHHPCSSAVYAGFLHYTLSAAGAQQKESRVSGGLSPPVRRWTAPPERWRPGCGGRSSRAPPCPQSRRAPSHAWAAR